MRGNDGPGAGVEEVFGDGDGEGCAFFGVGGGAELVEEDERARAWRGAAMRLRLVTCAEKVERSCSMDCASPMSARKASKTGVTASSAGTGTPACAMHGDQAGGLEGDGFAAGVGAADDELAVVAG